LRVAETLKINATITSFSQVGVNLAPIALLIILRWLSPQQSTACLLDSQIGSDRIRAQSGRPTPSTYPQ
jgi:hypothetical protein